jgi:retron-type reverse transcriptase
MGRWRITEPKLRLISAAPFRDRVVHRALVNVLAPRFERRFIFDSYACRVGKGTHAAIDRFQQFARRFGYVLKCDIRKFFPSIDHLLLLERVGRVVKDRRVVDLCRTIIEHSNPQEPVVAYFPGDVLWTPHERRRGLPIGNQTSQFFANVYLDPLDHFVKERLRCRGYVRYVDDFVLCHDSPAQLHDWLRAIREFLESLRLTLHPTKCQIFPATQGTDFLGFRVFPTHRRLTKRSVKRFHRRIRQLQRAFLLGLISVAEIRARINAWIGHVEHGDTWRLRERLFREAVFSHGSATNTNSEA